MCIFEVNNGVSALSVVYEDGFIRPDANKMLPIRRIFKILNEVGVSTDGLTVVSVLMNASICSPKSNV